MQRYGERQREIQGMRYLFNRESGHPWKSAVPLAVSLAFFLTGAAGIRVLSAHSVQESAELLEKNLKRAAVECYAIEGGYPESIRYLEQNYGIYVDEEQYVVHYEYVGANLPPDISVFIGKDMGGKERFLWGR